MELRELFLSRLDDLLKEKKASYLELSKYLHVNKNTVYNWRLNRSFPGPEYVSKVAEYLNVPVWHLFTDIPSFVENILESGPLDVFPEELSGEKLTIDPSYINTFEVDSTIQEFVDAGISKLVATAKAQKILTLLKECQKELGDAEESSKIPLVPFKKA